MPRFTFIRDFYIPKGSTKVADRQSDAVAYVRSFQGKGRDGQPVERYEAAIFFGQQAKPVAHYTYRSEAERERSVREHFERRRGHDRYMTERRAAGPSDTAKRNGEIKRVLEEKFGQGRVSVKGGRGTAYGWVHVHFKFPRPDNMPYMDAEREIEQLLQNAGVKLGHYDSADYGSGHEIAIQWESRP